MAGTKSGFRATSSARISRAPLRSSRAQQEIAEEGLVVEAQARRVTPRTHGLALRPCRPGRLACDVERQGDAAPARHRIAPGRGESGALAQEPGLVLARGGGEQGSDLGAVHDP
ncbi:MAG: hypothetical protein O2825_13835 [Proteobacteria bacterium]|nr:hypothetical protein [Pseudomonadota bacterium]